MEKKNINVIVIAAVIFLMTNVSSFLIGRYLFPGKIKNDKRNVREEKPVVPPKFNDEGNLVRGATKDYKVTIREFSNFFCGYCRRVQGPMKQLIEKYPDKVRHVLKNFPNMRHPLSQMAAKGLSAAVLQGKGEQMRELLYTKRFKNEQELFALAQSLGLNLYRFKKDFNSDAVDSKIKRDMIEGRALRFRGTPSFWVDGVRIVGAKPFEHWDQLVRRKFSGAK